MNPYNNVTREQIKKWWVLARIIGHNRARWTTKSVTRGISSLTHPSMTKTKMGVVLDVMSQEAAARGATTAATTQPTNTQEKLIHLVTADQNTAIARLKSILKFTANDFETMCQRVLKKKRPETHQDAVILMSRMTKAISETRK